MQLIYDNIVFGVQRHGGISVVWQELLERIPQTMDVSYIDVDNSNGFNYSRSKLEIPSSAILKEIGYPKITRYFPVRLSLDNPFLFHSSYYRYCTNRHAHNITTVHDFTYELFNKGIRQKVHTWQKFSAIRHSAAVVCISENTKRDLLRLMPDVDEGKVSVIYNGVSDAYHMLDCPLSDKELPYPSHSYVIFIGRRDSYKNFELTVKAVAGTKWNLLIVGSQLNESESLLVEKYLKKDRYQCLSHIPDELLNRYYNEAAALVYPSSYEGFGLPVLEAQRAGCPVIALNASSIPEIIGKTPLLMKELSETELVDKLELLDDLRLMQQVVIEGLDNSKRFSWEKMACQYAELYHKLSTTDRNALI